MHSGRRRSCRIANDVLRSSPLVRLATLVLAVLPLSGCLTIAILALKEYDRGNEFENTADGRVHVDYVDACYWKGRYEPSESVCGRLIEVRDSSASVEYVHGLEDKCVYSFLVDKKSRLITSWRYISSSEHCRMRTRIEADVGGG